MDLFTALLLSVVAGVAYMTRRIVGDTQFERPIVLAPIVGLILGDPLTGVIVGGTFELIFIGAAAIGGAVPPNLVIATVLGTAFAIQTGEGTETALLVGLPAAIVGSTFELLAKGGSSFLVHNADNYAAVANGRAVTGVVWVGNAIHFFAYVIPTFIALYLGRAAVQTITNALPEPVSNGLEVAANLLPAVGFAILLSVLARRGWVALFLIGFVVTGYTNFSIIGVAILGIAAVWVILNRPTTRPV